MSEWNIMYGSNSAMGIMEIHFVDHVHTCIFRVSIESVDCFECVSGPLAHGENLFVITND